MGATEDTEDTEKEMDGRADQMDAYVDEYDEPDVALSKLTSCVIGALIAVHKGLGPGHMEMTYKNAMALEFRARDIAFQREVVIPIHYRGEKVGETRLDFVVGDTLKVIVEVKAVETLAAIHTSQCISYLRASGLRLAILVNFNVRRLVDGLKRIAF